LVITAGSSFWTLDVSATTSAPPDPPVDPPVVAAVEEEPLEEEPPPHPAAASASAATPAATVAPRPNLRLFIAILLGWRTAGRRARPVSRAIVAVRDADVKM
jgi:hypothetical protein